MKKILSIVLALAMVLTMAACGSADAEPTTPAAAETAGPASALELLENVWAQYGDEEKFPIIGGNIEANIMDAPGNYDMAYAENMTYNLLVPAEQIENVSEAASMIHMMNANTFTCGAFKLADGVSVEDFGAAMQAAVQGNMWMCGFPERLLIQSVGSEYVVVAFGINDAMTPFATHLAEAYPNAQTLADEPIA
jgi:hypothetical protein